MQTLRQLALLACLFGAGLGMANSAQAAPAAGIIQAAPAVTASATAPSTPLIEKAWWYHRCWHCWHRWHYWHRCWHCWHRHHYWHRYYY